MACRSLINAEWWRGMVARSDGAERRRGVVARRDAGASRRQRTARLHERLQAAQYAHPALTGDLLGGLRRVLELVVHQREQADAVFALLDLPGDAARLLVGALLVPPR